MRHISEISDILKQHCSIDKRLLKTVALMVCALLQMRTVNLKQLAPAIAQGIKYESAYRKLQRLMEKLSVDMLSLSVCLLSWFYKVDEKIYLVIDRTQWQWGKHKINFLVIAVPYKRIAIPLIWVLLPKKGNSSHQERIALLERLFRRIPQERIKGVIGDREFIGQHWFRWLANKEIPFYMRIIDNANTTNTRGLEVKVASLFYDLKPGDMRTLTGKRVVYGNRVYLTGSRLTSGELMVVASLTDKACAINVYKERWEIETLFQNLKSRGFDMESTHMTDLDKLHNLMGIVTIAACWAYRSGSWRIDEGELIKVKKHGRPSKSLFRHGLDKLQSLLFQPFSWKKWKPLIALWKELKSPKPVTTSCIE